MYKVGVRVKVCSICGVEKGLEEFHRVRPGDGAGDRRPMCAVCRRGLMAARREERRAHHLVEAALERGELVRPACCSGCGGACRPDAHHADYERPLVVEWLCRSCHRRRHTGLSLEAVVRKAVSVRLDEDLLARAKAVAKGRGVSLTAGVEAGLGLWLEQGDGAERRPVTSVTGRAACHAAVPEPAPRPPAEVTRPVVRWSALPRPEHLATCRCGVCRPS